jgi:serine/threonine protein kinase
MATARCTKCGSENPKEALFCTACGHALHHEQNDPLIGQTIGGRYYLVERIGQGAAGTIYRSEHTTLRRRMALKLLHQQLAQNEDAVERFRREAITVCEIDNDHIPQVFDFGRAEDGRLFFAMEFLDGAPLSTVLEQEGRLTPERTADILSQIGDGLMEAHTLGYIHRDLRPRSIFLTRRRGRADFVKILDFGLAKLVQPDLTDAQRTAMGMTYGDPRYMAPEQARGEVADRRADIYSLGVLGYEMVCGEPPFKGTGTFDILSKLLEAPVPRLRDKRPDCPPWLESVIRTALAKKPAERFQTVAQFLDAMERKNVLSNQPPMPMQVSPGAKADAMKKLTPISSPEGGGKGQEVRAFVSSPGMKPLTVPVDVSSRPAQNATQVMPTVAPGSRAAALAATIDSAEAPQHERPQSIKKTLAYPAIKVGQRSDVVVAAPPVSAPAAPVRSTAVLPESAAAASAPNVAPVSKPATVTEPAKPPAKLIQSGFVNIVATTIERGDPTPRTARAMLEQESLAWEEAALPALLTSEVDLTDAAVSSDLTKLPPSADTPVEEMKFDAATANKAGVSPQASPSAAASVKAQTPRESSAPVIAKVTPSREPSTPTAVKVTATKEASSPVGTKAAAPREPIAKETSAPTGQRDSSRVAVMATPAPVAGREQSGPATKNSEPVKSVSSVVAPSPSVEIPRAKVSASSTEVRPLSAPVLGRSTKPGMGPFSPETATSPGPVLESVPVQTTASTLHSENTGPSQRHDETHKVVKVETVSSTETVKHPKLSVSELTQSETIKVEKVDPASVHRESEEGSDESDTVVTTRGELAHTDSDRAHPTAESERTPESPPPDMGSEGDAGWFAQSDSPTTAVGLIDDDDAPSLKQKTPRWVIPAALSAAAVLGLLIVSQGGSQKSAETSATTPAPTASSTAASAEPVQKAEAAPTAPTTIPTEGTKPAASAGAQAVEPATAPKPEVRALAEAKPEVAAKPTPTVEPLPVKAEPQPVAAKPEPPVVKAEPKPEPKPVVAKAEPKPEPKPVVAKAEPKPEPKPVVAKAEPKPAKAEPKPEPKLELKPPVDAAPAKGSSEVASLVSLGKQKLDDGDVDAAIASFKRAVQLDGKNADAVAGLGEASFEHGNFDAAAKYLSQAAKLSPRKLSYQELLAQAQFKLGRYKDAAETCRKILKENPGSGRAKQTLEQAEKKLDDM